MMKRFLRLILPIVILSVLVSAPILSAQDKPRNHDVAYYAFYDDTALQIYQWFADRRPARQLTHSQNDVRSFAVAYDASSLAFIDNDAKLWLQPLDASAPELLTTLTGPLVDVPTFEYFNPGLMYSQDNHYLAYKDGGIWVLDMSTRETHQVFKDIPLKDDQSNKSEARSSIIKMFVPDAQGQAAKLLIDMGHKTMGLYDLASGDMQTMTLNVPDSPFYSVIHLRDDRVIVFGLFPTLYLANSVADLNTLTPILTFDTVTDLKLLPVDGIETTPGTVRIYGEASTENAPSIFALDYNLKTQATNFNVNPLPTWGFADLLSPDGLLAINYLNSDQPFGLIDVVTGQIHDAYAPPGMNGFTWQPQP